MLFNWNAGMHGSRSGGNAVRDKSDVKFRMVYDIAGAAPFAIAKCIWRA